MADVTLTKEQEAAIRTEGKIIVSASAGSGKTFVMIRRLIDKILGDLEMQDFLAVTFTEKAAASMKDKLRKALIEAINQTEDPEKKKALKRKLSELPMADVSTIHSFCLHLLKRYFYEIGVSDSLALATSDSAEGKALLQEAMDEVISTAFEEGEEDFYLLLSAFRDRNGSKALEEHILSVYQTMRTYENYREILLSGADAYDEKGFEEACKEYYSFFTDRIKEFRAEFDEFYEPTPDMPKDCIKTYEYINVVLSELETANDVFEFFTMAFPAPPKKGGTKIRDESQKCYLDELDGFGRKLAKFLKYEIHERSFGDKQTELFRHLASGQLVKALYRYVLKYDDAYTALKAKRARMDFNDLEHYALRLLRNDAVREAVKSKYRYVFVDEYQDVNPVQENIISAISGENVFLVGDKKQAIYSFRGGKSKYFTQKEKEFGEGNLVLSSNFRSAKGILDFVNAIFNNVMTKALCGIDYQKNPMQGGERYEGHEGIVKIYCTEKAEKEESAEKDTLDHFYHIEDAVTGAKTAETAQAKTVYAIIDSCVNHPTADPRSATPQTDEPWYYFDLERKEKKRVRYGDIAILLRSTQDAEATSITNYLVSNGIPVTSLTPVNVCDYPEVKKLIGILQYLDNAEADVPLCVTLLSPIGNFNETELSAVKIYFDEDEEAKALPFRKKCERYAESQNDAIAEKLRRFYENVSLLKRRTCILSAAEIVNLVLADFGMETQILAKDNGVNCMARVNRFIAESGEDTVHEFLKTLRRLDYDVRYTENNGENSVKLLTIHKSKGLEFPVVILPELRKTFHSSGEKKNDIVYTEEKGFVPKFFDFEEMKKYTSIYRLCAEKEIERECINDELNLFYVALTRAQYALYLVTKEAGESKSTAKYHCYADFIDENVYEKYLGEIPYAEKRENLRDAIPLSGCADELRRLKDVYEKPYSFASSKNVAVKSSATTLMKNEGEEEEFYAVAHPFKAIDEGGADLNVNADVGTAYHAFLEHADFSLPDGGFAEMAKLLPKEQFELLSESKCKQILSLPLFQKLAACRLFRERKFIVSFPANRFDDKIESEDDVIYQGAIDLLALGKEGAIVVDYKYSRRSAGDIRRHYAKQIELYKAVTAKILHVDESTVRAVILNIFRGEEIPMD